MKLSAKFSYKAGGAVTCGYNQLFTGKFSLGGFELDTSVTFGCNRGYGRSTVVDSAEFLVGTA